MERRGIATVCLSLMREITEKVRPPRSLFVPFGFGYPLGRANDPAMQRDVMQTALGMVADPSVKAGALVEYRGD